VHCNIRVSPPSSPQGTKLLSKVCRRTWKWYAVRSDHWLLSPVNLYSGTRSEPCDFWRAFKRSGQNGPAEIKFCRWELQSSCVSLNCIYLAES
jgi:hypothetical protein